MGSEQWNTTLKGETAERAEEWSERVGEPTRAQAARRLIQKGLDAESRDEPFPERGRPVDTFITVLLLAAVLSTPFGAVGVYAATTGQFVAWSIFAPFAFLGVLWSVVAIGLMTYRHGQVRTDRQTVALTDGGK